MTNRTKEQLKKHYKEYQGKPDQIRKRASRNKARRQAEKEGRVHKNDGKDLDHKNSNPLDNRKENLRVVSKKKNRGKRSKSGKTI